jgi:hypothetical protein
MSHHELKIRFTFEISLIILERLGNLAEFSLNMKWNDGILSHLSGLCNEV